MALTDQIDRSLAARAARTEEISVRIKALQADVNAAKAADAVDRYIQRYAKVLAILPQLSEFQKKCVREDYLDQRAYRVLVDLKLMNTRARVAMGLPTSTVDGDVLRDILRERPIPLKIIVRVVLYATEAHNNVKLELGDGDSDAEWTRVREVLHLGEVFLAGKSIPEGAAAIVERLSAMDTAPENEALAVLKHMLPRASTSGDSAGVL